MASKFTNLKRMFLFKFLLCHIPDYWGKPLKASITVSCGASILLHRLRIGTVCKETQWLPCYSRLGGSSSGSESNVPWRVWGYFSFEFIRIITENIKSLFLKFHSSSCTVIRSHKILNNYVQNVHICSRNWHHLYLNIFTDWKKASYQKINTFNTRKLNTEFNAVFRLLFQFTSLMCSYLLASPTCIWRKSPNKFELYV